MSKKNHLHESIKAMDIKSSDEPKLITDAGEIVASVNVALADSKVKSATGLIYGRIQSGKTRAMIASSAQLFDEGVKIIVILTSNMNELVRQTYERFDAGLTQVSVLTKQHDLEGAVMRNKIALADASADAKLMLVMPKGPDPLKKTCDFLDKIDAKKYKVVIYDDEADQASLDTTKSKAYKGIEVKPSATFTNIKAIRSILGQHVYIAVTGTPNANVMQEEEHRPDNFVFILQPGSEYVGGKEYFDSDVDQNKYVCEIPDEDKVAFTGDDSGDVPKSLKEALLDFVFKATTANLKGHISEQGKGYQFLCHPSHKVLPQGNAYDAIQETLDLLMLSLSGKSTDIEDMVEKSMKNIVERYKLDGSEWKPLLKKEAMALLQNAQILQVNSKSQTKNITYSSGLNILIGGNSLGRGVTIPNLITTYYTRGGKVSYADTMHQHARMFGYRKALLPYTDIYLTADLYNRFKDVVLQDERLRDYIEDSDIGDAPVPIILTGKNIKPTRANVLPPQIVIDGGQKYPNPIDVTKLAKVHDALNKKVAKVYGVSKSSSADLQVVSKSRKDVQISLDQLADILGTLKLNKNGPLWKSDGVKAILEGLYGKGIKVLINYRESSRKIESGIVGGASRSGILYGTELARGLGNSEPTLWLHSIETGGERIIYPTLLLPHPKHVVVIAGDM